MIWRLFLILVQSNMGVVNYYKFMVYETSNFKLNLLLN